MSAHEREIQRLHEQMRLEALIAARANALLKALPGPEEDGDLEWAYQLAYDATMGTKPPDEPNRSGPNG